MYPNKVYVYSTFGKWQESQNSDLTLSHSGHLLSDRQTKPNIQNMLIQYVL